MTQLSAETNLRIATDNSLQTQINQIIAPTGEAPSAAEVQNARIGVDSTTYNTLGNAIRTQIENVDAFYDVYNPKTLHFTRSDSNSYFTINPDEYTVSVSKTFSGQQSYNTYYYTSPGDYFKAGDKVYLFAESTHEKLYGQLYCTYGSGSLSFVKNVYTSDYYEIQPDLKAFLYRVTVIPNGTQEITGSIKIKLIKNFESSFESIAEQALPNGTDFNTVINCNKAYILESGYTYYNYPNPPYDMASPNNGYLFVYRLGTLTLQMFVRYSSGAIYKRVLNRYGTVQIDWHKLAFTSIGVIPNNTDFNDLTEIGTYLITSDYKYLNIPPQMDDGSAGFLQVYAAGGYVFQIAIRYSGAKMYKRTQKGNTWEDWQLINEASGDTYNISNNYSFPEYQQTVTLTAYPQITTDSNNYLASANDTTDRTADILSMLQSVGVCNLGPGVFYVNNLQMPNDTTINGSGCKTVVRLAGSSDGFTIKLGNNCKVSNLHIQGGDSAPSFSSPTVGGRHGILWQGTYTESQNTVTRSIIDNVWINNFSGGGITCYDTGYPSIACLEVTNAYIFECMAGLNISYFSEFSKYTNVRASGCYYGCVNNGGNNVFVNCDFSSNKEYGMYMDNSQGQSPNNTHGSAIGCVFNHTQHAGQSNSGTGISIVNCANGFIFRDVRYSLVKLI